MARERVIVSGLPRSGTSMMMRMLQAGGLWVHQDGARKADPSNPRGYYELEAVKRLHEEPTVLEGLSDGAVKVIFALAYHLPPSTPCAVVLMRRPVEEVASSQRRMLERLGTPVEHLHPSELAQAIDDFHAWARSQSHLRMLEVAYPAVLQDPVGESRRVKEFLGRELSVERMAAVVEQQLWRERMPLR